MTRTFRAIGAAAILAVAGITAAAGHPVPVAGTPVAAAPTFPYPHMSIRTAQEANAPDGTLFVTVDDGSARPQMSNGRAVPVNGTQSKGPAFDDPTRCARVHGQTEVCWRTGKSSVPRYGCGPPTPTGPASSSAPLTVTRPG